MNGCLIAAASFMLTTGACLWAHDWFAGIGYMSATTAWFLLAVIVSDE